MPQAVTTLPTIEQVDQAVRTFRLLADPTRVRILWSVLDAERSVGELAELVDAQPPAVSQHLAKLRLADLVTTRREGTFVYYRAVSDHVRALLTEALFHADHVVHRIPQHHVR